MVISRLASENEKSGIRGVRGDRGVEGMASQGVGGLHGVRRVEVVAFPAPSLVLFNSLDRIAKVDQLWPTSNQPTLLPSRVVPASCREREEGRGCSTF